MSVPDLRLLRVRNDHWRGDKSPAVTAANLARTIEDRWHALGHTNVRVWTAPRLTKLVWLGRDGVAHNSEIHTHEIISNLVNGLPPKATAHAEVPKL